VPWDEVHSVSAEGHVSKPSSKEECDFGAGWGWGLAVMVAPGRAGHIWGPSDPRSLAPLREQEIRGKSSGSLSAPCILGSGSRPGLHPPLCRQFIGCGKVPAILTDTSEPPRAITGVEITKSEVPGDLLPSGSWQALARLCGPKVTMADVQ
jgi:hypothetical protein